MNNIVIVQVINGIENLADGLRRVFFGEFTLLANSVEKLAPRC